MQKFQFSCFNLPEYESANQQAGTKLKKAAPKTMRLCESESLHLRIKLDFFLHRLWKFQVFKEFCFQDLGFSTLKLARFELV